MSSSPSPCRSEPSVDRSSDVDCPSSSVGSWKLRSRCLLPLDSPHFDGFLFFGREKPAALTASERRISSCACVLSSLRSPWSAPLPLNPYLLPPLPWLTKTESPSLPLAFLSSCRDKHRSAARPISADAALS